MASQQDALSQLAELTDAGSGRSLVELGWIQQLRLEGTRVVFRLALPGFAQSQRDSIAAEARSRLEALDGIDSVQIELAQPGEGAPIGAVEPDRGTPTSEVARGVSFSACSDQHNPGVFGTKVMWGALPYWCVRLLV